MELRASRSVVMWPLVVVGRAFVKLHDDVAVQRGLDLHRDLGRQEQLVAVDRAGEFDTFFAEILRISPRLHT
jgi:hypothetical protein